jgi:ferredoxin
MAIIEDRYDDNVTGLFYVDSECIACDTCGSMARSFFKLTDNFDHAVVYSQPQTEEDIALCQDTLDACPVDAIGRCEAYVQS